MINCNECEERIQHDIDLISEFAKKTIRRLYIIILALVIICVGTNAFWIYKDVESKRIEECASIVEDGRDYMKEFQLPIQVVY